MKKIYLAIVSFAISISLFAQSNDPAAKAILDGVSAKFKTFKTVQASFVYNVENAAGKLLSTQKGTVWMKGTKYRISFGDQEIFSNGSIVWNYDKSANEVTISNLDASSGMITPQKLFTNFYDKDFLYKVNGEKRIGGKMIQEIEMTPTDKSKAFHKVYVLVDKNAKTINTTRVLEKSGGRYSYAVSSMKTNTTLNDSQFVFDKNKYPGVEVVDLR